MQAADRMAPVEASKLPACYRLIHDAWTNHMSTLANTVEKQEREIVRVARRILNGEVSIITGAREMTSVSLRSHSDDRDDEFLLFAGIDSEKDHLPLGDVRSLWAADALIRKDAQINEAEDFFRERALNAARILIERYERKVRDET